MSLDPFDGETAGQQGLVGHCVVHLVRLVIHLVERDVCWVVLDRLWCGVGLQWLECFSEGGEMLRRVELGKILNGSGSECNATYMSREWGLGRWKTIGKIEY